MNLPIWHFQAAGGLKEDAVAVVIPFSAWHIAANESVKNV